MAEPGRSLGPLRSFISFVESVWFLSIFSAMIRKGVEAPGGGASKEKKNVDEVSQGGHLALEDGKMVVFSAPHREAAESHSFAVHFRYRRL